MSSNPTPYSTSNPPPQASAAEPAEIFPGEVFADTADFDTGIRQLLPRYDEMLDAICASSFRAAPLTHQRFAIAHCLPPNAQRILDLGWGFI